jgi:PAS domain S-box-containing protein
MPNENFALAFDACPAAMLMIDPSGRIELVNSQCEQIFGYSRGEMVGLNVDGLLPESLRESHRSQRTTYVAAPQKRLMGVGRDLRARRRDGLEFPVEIGLTPVTTAQGMRILVFAVDITVRRDSEARLKESQDNLRRANQGLASFAYVASHDIQEPLRKICAFAEILDGALTSGDSQEMRYAAGVMADSARRARGLVADLLTMSRSIESELVLESFPIGPLIDEAKEHCAQAIHDTQARIEIIGDDFLLQGDRSLTLHILVNLLSNALKYGKPGQPPSVRVRLSVGAAENLLTVEDDGVGFPQVHAETIFEPFRRLHGRSAASGHGIGLAICKTAASRHGWRISARGRPDIGSEFEIVFPCLENSA